MCENKSKLINIRGLNNEVFQNLQMLAEENSRSLEGEARYAVQQWCNMNKFRKGNITFNNTDYLKNIVILIPKHDKENNISIEVKYESRNLPK
ncbi:hypothetical protein ACWA5Z_10235 [Testudinibacter sp. P80/BLE/0925]|uniref:hypothetical protein n=1 Tax=Testudinibacter sp. TW-1 TaxID=3417757 RepID=UPI003D3637B1